MSNPPIIVKLFRSLPPSIRQLVTPLSAFALYFDSGLRENGWFHSLEEMMPVSKNGRPIPWFNYSTISFIDSRINSDLNIFEYGSGNSTRWFAQRSNHITSVEHNEKWAELVKPKLPNNAILYFEESKSDYTQKIIETNDRVDVVIVDGQWRNECVNIAVEELDDNAVIILDNSNRDEYESAWAQLEESGYNHLRFEGMAPLLRNLTVTSVFYKENNCLGI
jgi:hypothetical protein